MYFFLEHKMSADVSSNTHIEEEYSDEEYSDEECIYNGENVSLTISEGLNIINLKSKPDSNFPEELSENEGTMIKKDIYITNINGLQKFISQMNHLRIIYLPLGDPELRIINCHKGYEHRLITNINILLEKNIILTT
jgi:hypothetical protein